MQKEHYHYPLWSFRSHRFRVALVLMFGMYMSFANTASLGIGIICMVNSTAYSHDNAIVSEITNQSTIDLSKCHRPIVEETEHDTGYNGEILWSPTYQSALFSANYYGSFVTVFFSGMLADRFGPKRLLIALFTMNTIITWLAPTIARFDYWTFFGARMLMGMGDGFLIPSINSLGAWWFPITEKSSMAALYTSGVQLAAGSSSFIGSRLCTVPFLGGWPLIFYLFGSLGLIWIVIFSITVTDHPSDNKWLTKHELSFLEESHEEGERKKRISDIPWSSILQSAPMWSAILCNLTFSFCASLNINFLPLYFKEELSLSLKSNGLFTVAPFISQLIFKNILAYIADHWKKTGKFSPDLTVKLFQAIGSFGSAALYIAMATLPNCQQPWIAVVCLLLFGMTYSSGICGFYTVIMTIAPAYSGTLTSLMMIMGQIGNMLAPNTVSFVTLMKWPHKWSIIFGFGAILQICSGIIFMIFGSGEVAPWARSKASIAAQKAILLKETEVEMSSISENRAEA